MTTKPIKTPAIRVTVVIYVMALSLLIGLGSWQVKRGLEKKHIETLVSRQTLSHVDQRPTNWTDLNYQQVIVHGSWIQEHTFLLENRVNQGRLGFELLEPFELKQDGSVILVNRGWVEKISLNEFELSRVRDQSDAEVMDMVSVSGQLYLPQKGFTLGPAYTDANAWPRLVQYFDKKALGQALDTELEPVILVELNPMPGLIANWSPWVVDASRHYGYAFQWWALALTLGIYGVIWKRNKHS